MARAMAEKAAADRAAAEAERKASEDKVRKLEEEIRKLKRAAAGPDDPTDPKAKPNPDSDEASSAFSTAEYYFNGGHYETALKLFDGIAERHPKEVVGVMALCGSVRVWRRRTGQRKWKNVARRSRPASVSSPPRRGCSGKNGWR